MDDLLSNPKNQGPHTRGRRYVAIGVVRHEDGGKVVRRIDYSVAQFRRLLDGDEAIRNELRGLIEHPRSRRRR